MSQPYKHTSIRFCPFCGFENPYHVKNSETVCGKCYARFIVVKSYILKENRRDTKILREAIGDNQ